MEKDKKRKSSFLNLPQDHKKRQILITILAGVFLTLIFVFVFSIISEGDVTRPQTKPKLDKLNIDTAGDRSKPDEIWRYNIEGDQEKLKKNISSLEEELKKAMNQGDNTLDTKKEIDLLKSEISKLYQAFAERERQIADSIDMENESEIHKISLNLSNRKQKKKISSYENTIGAGAFVKAVLLGGIDASTSMSSSSDPRPLLLRMVDEGVLPRKWQNDLKDCHVIASGYGDISSERVYARLEKMTCTDRRTGEIIETDVAGYIAGEDGRVGVRGKVVSKDGALIGNGLISSVLSGASKVLTQEKTINPFSGNNKFLNESSKEEKFKQGFGSGASSAVDRLSQYYIDRAEQIQPVIQVSSGRIVDIVFTKSSMIGSNKTKTGKEKDNGK